MLNEEKLNKVVDQGLDILLNVLKAKKPTKDQLFQARLASSVLSTSARFEASRNSRLSLQIRVASLVLKDTTERKKYLAVASPELKLLG